MDPPFLRRRPETEVARVIRVITEASTTPAEVEARDGRRWVLKFSGAGPGPYGLLIEYVALAIARAFGTPVPEARPLWLAEDFPWMAGTDEFDSMLRRSPGWNLGIALVPDARPATAAEALAADPAMLETIARSDCLLANVDRMPPNPNLILADGRLWSIDYDACLYLSRALGPARPAEIALPVGHFLRARWPEPRRAPVPPLDFDMLVGAVPGAWIAAAGNDRARIAEALRAYVAAWAA
ncbi:HipA family kinase [uncultured Amaricoccus sp.]|uniref:HipA family kinase n=1 Tax=uncultured Amaricoccus sp. TaxID=339341 RepID=UPI002635A059|nr:HipA family kinase [uncultured Amaricoccus sp.]